MKKKIASISLSLLAVLMILVSSLALPAASAATTPVNQNNKITTETGPTDELGGGDHFYVRFGSDAAFGIIWGNETNPNNIYFVSYISRYLGYINVDYPNGTELTQKPLKIYTLYAVELNRLIEYNDSDGNGILNYAPFTDLSSLGHENIYKGANLDTVWTPTNWQNGTDANGNLTWSFTLTTNDLHYRYNPLYNTSADMSGDNLLNRVALTFHLTASTQQVDNISVPQWQVTMTRGLLGVPRFRDLQKGDNLTLSGNITSYHVKWSKDIEGWDLNPQNQHPMIMAEYRALVMNYVPQAVTGLMALSECQKMVAATGENGTMITEGREMNESTSLNSAFLLDTPRLTFGGERSQIGKFEWVQNVTVDGQMKNATSQVTGLMPFNSFFGGKDFYGFIASVGISYPYGLNIMQDPEISSQAITDSALSSSGSAGTSPHSIPFAGLALVALIVAAIVMVAVLVVHRRPKTGKIEYEQKENQPKNDWGKYYEKK